MLIIAPETVISKRTNGMENDHFLVWFLNLQRSSSRHLRFTTQLLANYLHGYREAPSDFPLITSIFSLAGYYMSHF